MLRVTRPAVHRFGTRGMLRVPDLGFVRGAGLPGLFSPRGLDIAWFEYQHHLTTLMNEYIESHPELKPEERSSALALAEHGAQSGAAGSDAAARRRVGAVAAQAYTNELFFGSLRRDGSVNPASVRDVESGAVYNRDAVAGDKHIDVSGSVLNAPPAPEPAASSSASSSAMAFVGTRRPVHPAHELVTDSRTFGDVGVFREVLIARGAAQFGNGAVWLVNAGGKGGVLNTYGWGLPLRAGAAGEQQQPDAGSIYASITSTGALQAVPVLCVNLWEHVYLHDYGVAGKREFLTNVFDCLDWGVVDDRLRTIAN